MRKYIGERTPDGCQVVVIDQSNPNGSYLLNPRYDLRNHSPDGFSFGFNGSGPAQLSLALLADALGDIGCAQANYYPGVKVARICHVKPALRPRGGTDHGPGTSRRP